MSLKQEHWQSSLLQPAQGLRVGFFILGMFYSVCHNQEEVEIIQGQSKQALEVNSLSPLCQYVSNVRLWCKLGILGLF